MVLAKVIYLGELALQGSCPSYRECAFHTCIYTVWCSVLSIFVHVEVDLTS